MPPVCGTKRLLEGHHVIGSDFPRRRRVLFISGGVGPGVEGNGFGTMEGMLGNTTPFVTTGERTTTQPTVVRNESVLLIKVATQIHRVDCSLNPTSPLLFSSSPFLSVSRLCGARSRRRRKREALASFKNPKTFESQEGWKEENQRCR